uniref:non-specific serine/threonine protein kinase n=1 Tax=Brassica oleracea var. oleracea TaxID=109376 RepID=A0A0D3B6K0_BRAOL
MGKKGGFKKRVSKSAKPRNDFVDGEYDDEIDAFHKQRDIVPLDVNDDTDDSSDEDDVQPVFDLKGVDEDEDEEDEDTEEEEEDKGLIAKMVGQNKYLKAKFGAVDDEMADDDNDQDEENKRVTWGSRKNAYMNADNVDFENLSSDDEDLKLEEDEVLRMRAEQTGSITAADAGLEDDSEEEESDRELTMEEISVKGKKGTKSITDKKEKDVEVIKKDINSLSKEEQMDVVYSSAPEIVGLLSELNDAVEELENKINPVMSKLKEEGVPLTGGARYLEVKQILLLAYCQSITFYFLLKSEGQPIRDHPVLARLVDIKALLDKIKELDGELPPGFEESLARMQKVVKEDATSSPVSASEVKITQDTVEPVKISKSKADTKKKGEKRKHQNDQVDIQSEEMLKLRAALEGKLRSNGVFGSAVSKPDKSQKRQKLANRKLETFDDFVDDADNSTRDVPADKLTKHVSTKRKPKTVSGDDDLPQRDDIGERRRKFELKVLAGAGVKSEEDGKNESEVFGSDDDNDKDDDGDNDMVDSDGESEGEDEFYKQVKQNKQAKRAAKAEIYSREPSSISFEPETVDGKRVVSNAILSNRGLTRHRNKDKKNPRKNYRDKYTDKVKRRKGQVRDIRKPTGSYGGEGSVSLYNEVKKGKDCCCCLLKLFFICSHHSQLILAAGSREKEWKRKEEEGFWEAKARRSFRALKGLARLQGVVKGYNVKRQTVNAMKYMQQVVRVQSQIQSRRIKTLENQAQVEKDEAKWAAFKAGNENWDDSVLTKEERDARSQRKIDAIIKRERYMAYAYSHKLWKNSPKSAQDVQHSGGLSLWWNWGDRQLPLASPVPNHRQPLRDYMQTPTRLSPSRCFSQSSNQHRFRQDNNFDTSTPTSSRSRFLTPSRYSLGRLRGQDSPFKDDDSFASCPPYPRYMAPTVSAKAKVRPNSNPKERVMGTPSVSSEMVLEKHKTLKPVGNRNQLMNMSCRINLLMVLVIIALINTETSLGRLVMEGSAGFLNGFRTLTNTKKHVYGQAFSEEPLPFKNSTNGNVTSFSLTLLFAIAPENRHRGSHGMAFVISPTRGISGASADQYLGMFNDTNNGKNSNHVIAVELDIHKDDEFGDIDDNHVGINIDGMRSTMSAPAGYYDQKGQFRNLSLISGNLLQLTVLYSKEDKQLNVTLSSPEEAYYPEKPLLSLNQDLSPNILEKMYVGCTASTGSIGALHYVWSIHAYSFLIFPPYPKPESQVKRTVMVTFLTFALFVALVASASSLFFYKRHKMVKEVLEEWEIQCGPHRFAYKELFKATKGFHDRQLLGKGGFGQVFKGTLPGSNAEVAIKRVSHDSRQGMQEFLAEISTIGRLRHPNLVRLQGYCRYKEQLYLVYDFLPNGSLDKFLYQEKLTWDQRFKIIKDVASALCYLHNEWGQVVIHRDIKPANVLIDHQMNARLGDFGLAKLYDQGFDPQTSRVAGTLGRLIESRADTNKVVLVEWTLECWKIGDILEAVNETLRQEHNREQLLILGVLCSHQVAGVRPC